MGKIKPIGSEKLEGIEKLSRILEIARYNETIPAPLNETTSNNYNIQLSDGNIYHIDKEKNGYVIKKTIKEGKTEYVEPMKNRKFYSSYSQAFKRLNLIAKEVNTLTGNEEGISLFGEQKKFVLKTPKPEAAPAPELAPPAPVAATPPPSDVPPPPGDMGGDVPPPTDDMGGDMDMEEPPMDDMGSMDDMGGDEMPEPEGIDDESEPEDDGLVSFKTIQKLTGKLGQKLRKINQGEEPISADDTKYVINSILSALDLSVLSDEDMEEIIGRLEDSDFESEDDSDMGEPSDDMAPEEPEMDEPEMEEPSFDEELPEMEMYEEENDEQWEGTMAGEYDLGFSGKPKKSEAKEMNYNNFVKNQYASQIKKKMGDMMEDSDIDGVGRIFDSIFSESKVDSIIKSYFVKTDSEKKFIQEQNQKKFLTEKAKKVKIMKEVKSLSESFQQETISSKFLDRYTKANFIGKTNKKNLVFEVNGKQYKITPDGAIL
jgi:hypothetical protein